MTYSAVLGSSRAFGDQDVGLVYVSQTCMEAAYVQMREV